jgi:hypothetical protein
VFDAEPDTAAWTTITAGIFGSTAGGTRPNLCWNLLWLAIDLLNGTREARRVAGEFTTLAK